MIMIASALIGAVYGGLKAKKRKGSAFDIAQYIAVYAVIFSLIGLVLTVALMRVIG